MSSFKKTGGRYGMHSGSGHFKNLQVDKQLFVGNQLIQAANTPGNIYYVDRNVNAGGASGDGTSWETAFLTLAEAIAKVNADYVLGTADSNSKGRNRVIFVAEGWYAEVPVNLTASDVHIIGVAPGSHDSTVIYGVPVAGTFSGAALGPTLLISGSNNTIENMGFYCSSTSFASIQDGAHASDTLVIGGVDPGVVNSYNNKIINCNFIRDANNGSLGGIDIASNEGPEIYGCTFSTSCKDWGVRIRSNGVTNPVNVRIEDCRFTGIPTGVKVVAGHGTIIKNCIFMDDTTDRPGTVTVPCENTGGTNTAMMDCYGEFANGSFITGGDNLEIDNHQLA